MTLIELMIVLAIISIIAMLAVPSLRPLADANKLTGRAQVIAGFVDDARRMAYNLGVCHKIEKVGEDLVIRQRTHSDCTRIGLDDATDWTTPRRTQKGGESFFYTIKTTAGDASGTVIFRPNNRLWADGDRNVADDGARIVVHYPNTGKYKSIDITPLGRVCVKDFSTADPPTPTGALTCP